MKIVYALENDQGVRHVLNDQTVNMLEAGTMTLGADRFDFDNKIVEKTGQPGSVKIGSVRLESRNLKISFMRGYADYNEFRVRENELLQAVNECAYLVDVTAAKRIKVAVEKYEVDYDPGSYQLSSSHDIQLNALNPFWETEQAQEVSFEAAGNAVTKQLVDTQSFLATPPIVEITADSLCPTLKIYIEETQRGMEIVDSLWGTIGFKTFVIDNNAGTVATGNVDRTASVSATTGFFDMPPGNATCVISPAADCTVVLRWRPRTFV